VLRSIAERTGIRISAQAVLDDPAPAALSEETVEVVLRWVARRHHTLMIYGDTGELEEVRIYRAATVGPLAATVGGEPFTAVGEALAKNVALDLVASLLDPDTDAESRGRALGALRKAGLVAAEALVQVALQDPEPVLRREALELLGLNGEADPSARRALRDLSSLSHDEAVRAEARSLLAALEDIPMDRLPRP
jgi:DNA-binding transcriptional ArsR family regulator